MGRLMKTALRIIFYALFIILVSCPSPLEDKLTETIETEVKEATAEKYNLTIETPENGIINLSGTITVKDGISQQILVTPYQTHAFLRWEKVSGSGTVSFQSPENAETAFTVSGGDAVIRAVLTERPRVRYSTPTGTNVGYDSSIIVKFSTEMDASTITSDTFIISNADNGEAVSGIISYANKTATFKPETNLDSWTRFSIRVTRDVEDINGISLVEDYYSPSPFVTSNSGDTSLPVNGTFRINNDQTWTSTKLVELTDIFALDLNDGTITRMYISNSSGGTTWSDPYTYDEKANWILSDGDGTKTVYMQFEDASGNLNDQVNQTGGPGYVPDGDYITDTIKLDTTGPELAVVQTSGESGIAIDVDGDISANDSYTNSQDIDLYMDALDAGIGTSGDTAAEKQLEMLISQDLSGTQGEWDDTLNSGNGGYVSAGWEAFTDDTTVRTFRVDPGDGTKAVIVKFRDSLGNESAKTFDSIKLDQTAPTGSVTIDNDNQYTNQSTVNLEIAATDGGVNSTSIGSAEMFISNTADFSSGSWESYSAAKTAWTIDTASDGVKTVYIKFKDSLGNDQENSQAASDTIILDTADPVSGTVIINSGASSTNTGDLNLTISAADNSGGSGIDQMAFNFENVFTDAIWLPYSTSAVYNYPSVELPSSGNPMPVYASFRDKAGNEIDTSTPVTDSIIYDTTPPAGTFSINNDASYTNSTTVTINSSFSGVASMRFSNNNTTWTEWTAYSTTTGFTLTSGDGTKTVYAQYADGAGGTGNVSNSTDTIILDTVAPVVGSCYLEGTAVDDSATNLSYVTIHNDVSGSPSYMRFKNETTGSWSGWYSFSSTKTYWYLYNYNVDGTKRVYFQYKDAAGNETSETANYDTIILDKTAPTVSYFRIGASDNPAKTNDTTPDLYSNVTDSGSGMYQMNIGNHLDPWNGWESYASTRYNWPLKNPDTDEEKRIYCYYKDKAGNTTSTTLYDTIELDTTAPQNVSVVVNDGRKYAYDQEVTLTISADDVPSGSQMRFRYIVGSVYIWTDYEDFATTKTITLSDSDTTKYVYVQVMDDVGNVSGIYDNRDTIILDRPSIQYVTRGTPGGNGKVKVYLDTVNIDTASDENVYYRIYTSTTPDGAKSYRGYIYNSGDEIAPPAEETEYYFHVRMAHYYDGAWNYPDTYYKGSGGIDRTGYAADVIIIYKNGNSTDLTLATSLRDDIIQKNFPADYTWASGTQPAWSVKLVPDTDISDTYSAENTVYGKPAIITPGLYNDYTDSGKDGWVRNIAAAEQGIITMGAGAWVLDRIEENFTSWGFTDQAPTDVGYGESISYLTGSSDMAYSKVANANTIWRTPVSSTYVGTSPSTGSSYSIFSVTADSVGKAVSRPGGANPNGGYNYAQVNSGSYYYQIVRQGRFLFWGWSKIPNQLASGRMMFVNSVALMDGY